MTNTLAYFTKLYIGQPFYNIVRND